MICGVWRLVWGLKLDAGNSLERTWAQVMQQIPKTSQKWRPGGAFRSTLGLWRACSGGLLSSWVTFSHNFGVLEASFGRDFAKKCIFLIRAPLCSGIGGFGGRGQVESGRVRSRGPTRRHWGGQGDQSSTKRCPLRGHWQ